MKFLPVKQCVEFIEMASKSIQNKLANAHRASISIKKQIHNHLVNAVGVLYQ
jgi:hypothetical protein